MKYGFLQLLFFLLFFIEATSQTVYDACRKGDLERIKLLMTINKDTIDTPNENGFTPLIISCYRNQPEVVDFLLNHNVQINYISPEGTALIGVCYQGNLVIAKKLIRSKAEINIQNEEGLTALMFAVQGNHLELANLLIKEGAEKNLQNKYGKTALDFAKQNENKEMIRVLTN